MKLASRSHPDIYVGIGGMDVSTIPSTRRNDFGVFCAIDLALFSYSVRQSTPWLILGIYFPLHF
jgi:hypothetical protein